MADLEFVDWICTCPNGNDPLPCYSGDSSRGDCEHCVFGVNPDASP